MHKLKYFYCFENNADLDKIFKTGVYKLYHSLEPGVLYVGSASINNKKRNMSGFYRRLLSHINKLKSGKHHSKKLQYIIDHNGINGLRIEIIELCDGKILCRQREQFYLDALNPSLNNSKSSTSCKGVKHTDHTKEKHRIARAGKSLPEFVYEQIRREVHQFDKNGTLIKSFRSLQDASNVTGIDRATISHAAAGHRVSAGGYLWRLEAKCDPQKPKRLIRQYDINTRELVNEYKTLTEATASLNIISSTAIRNCFKGIQKQAYGYLWEDVNIKIEQAKALGLSESRLSKAI